MEQYKYHLGIYSKLLRGKGPDGPIKPGVEARLVASTEDFPERYQQLCTTSLFFPENPPVTKIDARRMKGGAFVFAPVYLKGEHLSVFSRIEARPERGKGQGGRRFTHCAALIVKDKWEPALIRWAARMLFTTQYGDRCWGLPVSEKQEDRNRLNCPDLRRADLPAEGFKDRGLKSLDDIVSISRVRLPCPSVEGDSVEAPGQVDVADWLADELETSGFSDGVRDGSAFATQGRFLSFASGVSDDITGPAGGGFFISLDTRATEEIAHGTPLGFDDTRPVWFPPPVQSDLAPIIPEWRHIKTFDQALHARRPNTLTADNYWPEHLPEEFANSVEVEGEQDASNASTVQAYVEEDDFVKVPITGKIEKPNTAHAEPVSDSDDGVDEIVLDLEGHDLAEAGFGAMYGIQSSGRSAASPPEAAQALYKLDTIQWPTLLKYRDLPQGETPPVSREKLREIALGFFQLDARLRLIMEPPFDHYPRSDVADRIIVGSFRDLLELIIDFAAAGRDPNQLRDELDRMFTHDPLPYLGVYTDNGGSMYRTMFRNYIEEVGVDRLIGEIHDIARRERNLAKYLSSREGRNIQLDVPNDELINEFFVWLNGFESYQQRDAKLHNPQAIWWDYGLGEFFSELYASTDELFGKTHD
ncbi:hypothetical protein [uncultured Tateyamaria sp.]|uniref:hypothetical protein n=1 Tax=uncultured Tateyamaria sp. TaxID=455651 RepID=UPI002618B445|nr:hypothetical protein [uncultured Tateyamaria sp.]